MNQAQAGHSYRIAVINLDSGSCGVTSYQTLADARGNLDVLRSNKPAYRREVHLEDWRGRTIEQF